MNKKDAEALEKSILPAELQTPAKEQPLGFDFKQGGVISLGRDQFFYMLNLMRPFQAVARILDEAQNQAVRDGNILPFYAKDVKEAQKDPQGNIVGYVLNDNFGSPEVKTDNSVSLLDAKGETLAAKKN